MQLTRFSQPLKNHTEIAVLGKQKGRSHLAMFVIFHYLQGVKTEYYTCIQKKESSAYGSELTLFADVDVVFFMLEERCKGCAY